mmetsp:Transcript_23782/g.62067  ORF Transcript_23782/g.62067 Transcript_23782/m.62067 type:complete len:330 (-) Transcript_23782:607-1596(-)
MYTARRRPISIKRLAIEKGSTMRPWSPAGRPGGARALGPRAQFFQPRLPRGCGETTRPSRGGGAASKIASGGGVTLRTNGGFDDGEGAGAAAAAASAALDARSVCALLRARCFAGFASLEGREWSKVSLSRDAWSGPPLINSNHSSWHNSSTVFRRSGTTSNRPFNKAWRGGSSGGRSFDPHRTRATASAMAAAKRSTFNKSSYAGYQTAPKKSWPKISSTMTAPNEKRSALAPSYDGLCSSSGAKKPGDPTKSCSKAPSSGMSAHKPKSHNLTMPASGFWYQLLGSPHTKMFSGLMSLCAIFALWQWRNANTNIRVALLTTFSGQPPG